MNKFKHILLGILIGYILLTCYLMVNNYFNVRKEKVFEEVDVSNLTSLYDSKLSKVDVNNLTDAGKTCLESIKKYYGEISNAKITTMSSKFVKETYFSEDDYYNVNILSIYNGCFGSSEENRTEMQKEGSTVIAPLLVNQMVLLTDVYNEYLYSFMFKIHNSYLSVINESNISELRYESLKRTEYTTAIKLFDYLEYKEVITNE